MLPSAATRSEFLACRQLPLDRWEPGLRAIVARHHLPVTPARRFERGENPVFELLGGQIVKLVPPFWATIADREAQCLNHLQTSGVPVPRLLGCGEQDGWHYVIQERSPGRNLEDLWPTLLPAERVDVARKMGEILAMLHRVPTGGLRPGGVVWSQLVQARINGWMGRKDVQRLPAALRDSGVPYIETYGFSAPSGEETVLHGDLAPENCLASVGEGGRVRVEAIIDFGNAMLGPPRFDLTAPSVVMGKGDPTLVQALLDGYGAPPLTVSVRRGLMAYTLIHPMGDVADCLEIIPGLADATSWDVVAEAFWPV